MSPSLPVDTPLLNPLEAQRAILVFAAAPTPNKELERDSMIKVSVSIRKKTGVFDPQAKVVRGALNDLGHEVFDMSIRKVIEFSMSNESDPRKKIEEMCDQLLVNPVLETYSIEFLSSPEEEKK